MIKDKKLSIVIIPSNHKGDYYRIPTYIYYPNFLSIEDPEEPIKAIAIPSRDVKLLPFILETGHKIRAGYDEETETVIMTENPFFKCSFRKGLAANYIAFILSLPKEAWDIEEKGED